MVWKVEEAEKRFGEVMHDALVGAPQIVIWPDGKAIVVISENRHYRLVLALQRLLALGEDPPEIPELKAGERNAWDFIQSLPPVDENGEPLFPEGYFRQLREEEHRRMCAARPMGSEPATEAAD